MGLDLQADRSDEAVRAHQCLFPNGFEYAPRVICWRGDHSSPRFAKLNRLVGLEAAL